MGTLVVGTVLLTVILMITFKILKDKKRGRICSSCSSCSSGCAFSPKD